MEYRLFGISSGFAVQNYTVAFIMGYSKEKMQKNQFLHLCYINLKNIS